jgi:hemoglobin
VKKPLKSREDIELLVNEFYNKVQADPVLSPIFNDVAKVHWDEHLPRMYDFWQDLLLGTNLYHGRPYPKHHVLPIDQSHFARWLELFYATLDTYFEGTRAEEARFRAGRIALRFQFNMGLITLSDS